jgi:hypothetical protein
MKGRVPDREITIMTRSDPDAYTGLFDSTIRSWWLAFQKKHKTYRLLWRSCAAVVGNALIEGGAEAFKKRPPGVWTPDSVYNWGVSLQKAVEVENQSIGEAFKTVKEAAKKFDNPGKLWTRSEWYKASEENVSFFSRRYGHLKTIDSLLDIYDGIDKRPQVTEDFKRQAKENCLALIMRGLAQILRERNKTKRLDAIGQLAAQIKKMFDDLKEDERKQIEQMERRIFLLEEYFPHDPNHTRLDEIFEEQFKLIDLIRQAEEGNVKLEKGQSLEQLRFQLQSLEEEEQQLDQNIF